MIRKSLISIFLLLIVLSGSAQATYYQFTENCKSAYQKLLYLQLDSASIFISQEKAAYPKNLFPLLLENYQDFLQLVLTEDKQLFNQLENQKKQRLNLWEDGPKSSPWHLAGQAQIKLQWAFTRVLFDEYFTAATEINSAYHLLEENKKLFPDFHSDNMGIGILHSMIGVVPDQYQWAMEMLGLHGSIEQGIKEMQEQLILDSSNTFSKEALFYYTFVRLNLQTDSSRFTELLSYYEQYAYKFCTDNSPILHFSKAVILLNFNNDLAIDFLRKSPTPDGSLDFYYPSFLLGQALLYRLDEHAVGYLNDYIQYYPGKIFKKTALQRSAWWSFIKKDTLAYQQKMQRINTIGSTILDADKVAEKESKKVADGWLPNLYLLRSRLQFDGHYYQGALNELATLETMNNQPEVQLEFYYRKGRIHHEMNQIKEAKKAYQMALDIGQNSDRKFAANAALKLGEITENANDYTKASHFYQLVLDLDFTEYRKGIRAKAKAGLQRVEE
ncbi:MAG: hypothetical protein GQ527_06950 [Bacteroidales bacterium]|nr:hypothetical protein [Bacteroidales bacterium]